ncbi:MAG: hypothetical protein V1856_03335 [Candidatus Liptonbacteria bacterium]
MSEVLGSRKRAARRSMYPGARWVYVSIENTTTEEDRRKSRITLAEARAMPGSFCDDRVVERTGGGYAAVTILRQPTAADPRRKMTLCFSATSGQQVEPEVLRGAMNQRAPEHVCK